MPARDITIINKLGLHARAAAKFVGVAGRSPGRAPAAPPGASLGDGKSSMAVMMLPAGQGTVLHLCTEGEQAEAALQALLALIDNYFDEGE